MTQGYLVLETGEYFEGEWIGSLNETAGEVVFNTSMTGYQEMMTDPSYAGQILTFCYPIIGSYGVNDTDDESGRVAVSAVIISDLCDEPSHYRSSATVSEQLKGMGVPGLKDVDTRSLVAAIRKHRTVRGKLVKSLTAQNSSGHTWGILPDEALVNQVSVKHDVYYPNPGPHIVLLDFGYKKSILNALLTEKCQVTVVRYDTPLSHIHSLNPDGVLISNGPGDPMELIGHFAKIKALVGSYPTLGICLGHQLIALAYGAETEKMPFGHRGGNHPVKDTVTGKVKMTSQNHGYVVKEGSLDTDQFQARFHNVNDGSLEGIAHRSLPVQSVQFHPEAHPGPSDTDYIFETFIRQAAGAGGKVYVEV